MNKKKESSLASRADQITTKHLFFSATPKVKSSLVNWINDDSHWASTEHIQKGLNFIFSVIIAPTENQIDWKRVFIFLWIYVSRLRSPYSRFGAFAVLSPCRKQCRVFLFFYLLRLTSTDTNQLGCEPHQISTVRWRQGVTPDRICFYWQRLAFASMQVHWGTFSSFLSIHIRSFSCFFGSPRFVSFFFISFLPFCIFLWENVCLPALFKYSKQTKEAGTISFRFFYALLSSLLYDRLYKECGTNALYLLSSLVDDLFSITSAAFWLKQKEKHIPQSTKKKRQTTAAR